MEKEEVIEGVKEAITQVCRASVDEIELTDKIKGYIPVIDGPNLAGEINNIFPKVRMTSLLNSLYDPISTVADLVDYVYEIYEG